MDWRTGSMYFLWLVLTLSSINGHAEKKVVCYYTNWSIYRPGTAKFSPQNINPYLCTHLIYAFGGFTKDNTLKPFDKYQDIEKGGYAKFTGLKTYNKNLKTMLAIGGWNEGSARFSPMVADPERRQAFVKNSVKFLRQNHFDGLDLDWEYPAFRDGGKPRDKDNYADLVQELRQEFERESSKTGRPRLLLSMAVPAGIEYLEKGYDLPRLNEYLDFFNLLSYDYHSAFEPAVNHHAPLYGLEEDNEYNYDSELTIDYTISYLLKHDVSSDKIILGIPTYGRSYTLFNQDATVIGSPADGPGEEGDATREKGYLAYYEICENVAKSNEWEIVQPNSKAMGPYAFKGNQWVGYDDENIVRLKSMYVIEKSLGGIMFWSIDNDDFRGKCHDRPYPLIEAAKEALLAGTENEQTTQKPKSGGRKKTRPQISGPRSDDSSSRRARPEKRRPSASTQPSRSRVSQRFGSNARTQGNFEENYGRKGEDVEEEGNAVKETSNRWKTNQRNRSSKVGNRRKVQTTERYEEPVEEEAKESTSIRFTTPEPPTTPDPGSDFKCEDEGFFSHPRDCKKYFWCLDSGAGGLGIVAHQFTCPSGLVFNKAADSCDYPRNVVCPKAKTKTATTTTTTTKAPITTTSRPTTTTRRTTTTEEYSAEEYEYDEDENITDEEVKEEVKTTPRSLVYKTIARNKPTTTAATEAPTTNSPRILKTSSDKVFDLEDEEDPRVIKELIELIKKAGGLEQLERQLNIQEKTPMRKSDDNGDNGQVTPATISRSLYERVLSRQANKVNNLFGLSTTQRTTTTTEGSKNSRVSPQNGPGGAQFEGLDDVPEVKSLRRTKKPQYVTIERQRPSTTPVSEDNFEEDQLEDEESEEQDNADVASSEDQAVSDLPESRKDSSKKVTPNYVNIRRTRPTTPAYENDLEARDQVPDREQSKFLQENADKTENESFSRQRPVTSTSNDEADLKEEKETAVSKNRYTNTQRFRSTTLRSNESTAFTESIKPSEKTTTEIVIPTTQVINQQEREQNLETFDFSTLPVSTIEFSSTPATEVPKESPVTEIVSGPKATISTTHLPLAEPTVKLVENFVTESSLTTESTSARVTQPPTTRTTAVSQPRPFGFPRRGRPTTTTSTASPTVLSSTTDQSRVKVSTRPTRNFVRTRARPKPSESTSDDKNHVDTEVSDNNLNETSKPKPASSSRTRFVIRRGGTRFSTSSPQNVTESSNEFAVRRRTRPTAQTTVSEATQSTTESRPTSHRRRGRPTTPIPEVTSQSNKRRRRPTAAPATDSPIIRIVPKSIDEPVLNFSKSGFNANVVPERITNIKILKIADSRNDSLNAIEFTTTESETSKLVDLDDSATESTILITSPDPFTKYTTTDYSTLTTPTLNADKNEREEKQIKKKVLLRKRPVSEVNYTDQDNLKRRRKVIRRLGPVSSEVLENPTTTSTDYIKDNEVVTTTESLFSFNDRESSTTEFTTSAATEYTTEVGVDATTLGIEESTTLISNDVDSETTTLSSEDSSEFTTVTTTSAPTTTEKASTRFLRRKFIRKRPVDYSATSTASPRRFGFSRTTTEIPTSSFTPSKRRKNLFIRRRPVPSTTSLSTESFDDDESNEFNTVTDVRSSSISPAQELPSLKNLINHEIKLNLDTHYHQDDDDSGGDSDSYEDQLIKSDSYETYSDNFQGIPVPVRILNDIDSKEVVNQLAVLHLPQSILNSLISHSSILRIQVVDKLKDNEIDQEHFTTTFQDFTATTEKSTTIQEENSSSIRGFFITKSIDSPSTTQSPDLLESSTVQSSTTQLSDSSEPSTVQSFESSKPTESTTQSTNSVEISTVSDDYSSKTISEVELNATTTNSIDVTNNNTTLEMIETTVAIREELTTLPPTTNHETISPDTEKSLTKSIKQITVLRRRVGEPRTDSPRQDRQLSNDSQEINKITPLPDTSQYHWKKRVIRKRARSLSIEDQSIAESQLQDTVDHLQLVSSPTESSGDEKPNETLSELTVGEVSPVKSTNNFLRKPGARPEVPSRFKPTRNKTQVDGASTERRYSSKVKLDHDQSSRAQELAVSVADPPADTSSSRLGNEREAAKSRDVRDSLDVNADEETTESSTLATRNTTPARRRQRPKSERVRETTTQRPRHPEIIDYDYYVDEVVRLSIGPELQDKIYVTARGTFGCLDQGTFAHPTSCKKFITCAKMVGGQVVATEYTCPKKLSFDPVGGICNWSAGLGCNESL
ncbi:mucin-5AC isoform X1 [Microplitis demolitor]|uniref:mucin-5AC isoform X1 n=1 Tax=Microplitis demolitor TaxID=69319 RepID=UPI0004CCEBF0|nr:mucin-5AC isoform X1 [Microplitis demolitor]